MSTMNKTRKLISPSSGEIFAGSTVLASLSPYGIALERVLRDQFGASRVYRVEFMPKSFPVVVFQIFDGRHNPRLHTYAQVLPPTVQERMERYMGSRDEASPWPSFYVDLPVFTP